MVDEAQVKQALEGVLVPAIKRSVTEMNLVRETNISGGEVKITLASTGLVTGAQDWIKEKVIKAVKTVSGVSGVSVEYVTAKPGEINGVRNVIAIMSGKGGVGKSLVASLTAVALKRRGYEVGILDADITGPSIPRMFGISDRPSGNDTGMLPVLSKSGIELMSINLLLPSEEEAVIWRGPLIGKAITQFWEEVLWGKLDYLVVDLPPGTADAPLTVLQTLPITGIVVVFTPQDLTAMVVKKAVKMAQQMGKKILGVVENMSYLYVPEIDKKIEIFGQSHGEEMAQSAGAPLLGQLPIDPTLAALCDAGDIERYEAELINGLGESISKETSPEK